MANQNPEQKFFEIIKPHSTYEFIGNQKYWIGLSIFLVALRYRDGRPFHHPQNCGCRAAIGRSRRGRYLLSSFARARFLGTVVKAKRRSGSCPREATSSRRTLSM